MKGPAARARRAKRAKCVVRRRRAQSIYQQVDGVFCGFHRQQHHILLRSRGGLETTANLVTLCQRHHEDVHARRLTIVGRDANQALRFERADAREMGD